MSSVVKNASGNKCSLSYCTSHWSDIHDGIQVSFFKFPKDHPRCASWVLKCGSKYLPTVKLNILHKTHMLCSVHFEKKMFSDTLKNKLKATAVPTLFKQKPVGLVDHSALFYYFVILFQTVLMIFIMYFVS